MRKLRYYCLKCERNHWYDSDIGMKHLKSRISGKSIKHIKKIEPITSELDIWIDKNKLDKFIEDFRSLNDIKIREIEIIKVTKDDNLDMRYSIVYRQFGEKDIIYPCGNYYQLKNHFQNLTGENEI